MKKAFPDRYCYPAIFTYEENQEIAVVFPDLELATSGIDDADALYSARDALDKTSKTFDDIDRSLRADGKSITTSARQLVELGVKQDKRHKLIPEKSDDETGA